MNGRREQMDDLIKRQDAITAYCEHECGIKGMTRENCGATDCGTIFDDIPSAQQWIACSERLPENEDIYLVTFDKSNLLDNEKQVSDAYWINNQWQYGVLESYERRMPKLVVEPIEELKVIAWMPLPEPYKGEVQ